MYFLTRGPLCEARVNKIALTVVLFLLAMNAQAMTGAELEDACHETEAATRAQDPVEAGVCLGFIKGFTTAISVYGTLTKTQFYCAPDSGVTTNQIVAMVRQYLQLHPSDKDKDAGLILHSALTDNFPCK